MGDSGVFLKSTMFRIANNAFCGFLFYIAYVQATKNNTKLSNALYIVSIVITTILNVLAYVIGTGVGV
jgi:hypothetical protein